MEEEEEDKFIEQNEKSSGTLRNSEGEESEAVENSKQQVSSSEEPSVAPDNVDSIFADFENGKCKIMMSV